MSHEVARDDDVQRHQDDERQCKEESDAEDEEESYPEGVGLSEAHSHCAAVKVLLVVIIGHAQDGAGNEKKPACFTDRSRTDTDKCLRNTTTVTLPFAFTSRNMIQTYLSMPF
jgi:hypothetical protein